MTFSVICLLGALQLGFCPQRWCSQCWLIPQERHQVHTLASGNSTLCGEL